MKSIINRFKIPKETRHAQLKYGYDEESEVESEDRDNKLSRSGEDVDERTLIQDIDSDMDNYKNGIIDVEELTFWLEKRIEVYERAKVKGNTDTVIPEPMAPVSQSSTTDIVFVAIGAIAIACFLWK